MLTLYMPAMEKSAEKILQVTITGGYFCPNISETNGHLINKPVFKKIYSVVNYVTFNSASVLRVN